MSDLKPNKPTGAQETWEQIYDLLGRLQAGLVGVDLPEAMKLMQQSADIPLLFMQLAMEKREAFIRSIYANQVRRWDAFYGLLTRTDYFQANAALAEIAQIDGDQAHQLGLLMMRHSLMLHFTTSAQIVLFTHSNSRDALSIELVASPQYVVRRVLQLGRYYEEKKSVEFTPAYLPTHRLAVTCHGSLSEYAGSTFVLVMTSSQELPNLELEIRVPIINWEPNK